MRCVLLNVEIFVALANLARIAWKLVLFSFVRGQLSVSFVLFLQDGGVEMIGGGGVGGLSTF